jgi:hypothetical protein
MDAATRDLRANNLIRETVSAYLSSWGGYTESVGISISIFKIAINLPHIFISPGGAGTVMPCAAAP